MKTTSGLQDMLYNELKNLLKPEPRSMFPDLLPSYDTILFSRAFVRTTSVPLKDLETIASLPENEKGGWMNITPELISGLKKQSFALEVNSSDIVSEAPDIWSNGEWGIR